MKIPPELGLPRNAIVLGDLQQLTQFIKDNSAKKPRKQKEIETPVLDKANEILLALAQHLAALATTAWKMERRLFDPDSQEVREGFSQGDARKLARDIRSLLSTLSDMGITIRDRTGEPFDYGMAEKVVDAQAQPGLTKERVAETLRPTITWSSDFWKDTMIQKGEVTIHTPEA